MPVTELSSRLRNMKFMKRGKAVTKQSREKKTKRSPKKKSIDHHLLNNSCAVVKDDSMNIYETLGRRRFGGFNGKFKVSSKLGHDKGSIDLVSEPVEITRVGEGREKRARNKISPMVKSSESKDDSLNICEERRRRRSRSSSEHLCDSPKRNHEKQSVSPGGKPMSVKVAKVKRKKKKFSMKDKSLKATRPVKTKHTTNCRAKVSPDQKSSKMARCVKLGKRFEGCKPQKVIRKKRKSRKQKRIRREQRAEDHAQLYKCPLTHRQQVNNPLVKVF